MNHNPHYQTTRKSQPVVELNQSTRAENHDKIHAMSKIIPVINNGNHKLVLSETVCIDPAQGLEIEIPINQEKLLKLAISFESNKKTGGKYDMAVSGDTLNIKFTNFLNVKGISLIEPITFNVGESKFLIRVYGFSNSENNLFMAISIYAEGGKG